MRCQQNHGQIPNADREPILQHHIHRESHSVTDLYLPSYGPIHGLLSAGWVWQFCPNIDAQSHIIKFFAIELCPVGCPTYRFGKWRRGGDLPSPAGVWRWGEVNRAVRTAVDVNLVKANEAEGMKNGSQLIHIFMPVGWFNQTDLIQNKCPHTHTSVIGIQLLWKATVSVLLSDGEIYF